MEYKEGKGREELLFPTHLDEIIGKNNYVRLIDVFVDHKSLIF